MMAATSTLPNAQHRAAKNSEGVFIAQLSTRERNSLTSFGAKVYEDVQFAHFGKQTGAFEERPRKSRHWNEPYPAYHGRKGLTNVMAHIRAPEAWNRSRGRGVTIAVVDTGICPNLTEFPDDKRSPIDIDSAYNSRHWEDENGHGSMCAAIACASDANGGLSNGVAPDATLVAARTDFRSADIYVIYDELIEMKRNGTIPGPLVISNSYGRYTCSPVTELPEDHPFLEIIIAAIDAGITVVFAAGNNHYDVKCKHDPATCGPNTIWGPNSHDRVLSVGTVNEEESNQDPTTPHANSSRGPGQWADTHPKPDCVAPTYGEVIWGCGYATMDWWGTSGACPQVAGLAALLLSIRPDFTPHDIAEHIRSSCRALAAGHNCVGHGIIDCGAALESIRRMA